MNFQKRIDKIMESAVGNAIDKAFKKGIPSISQESILKESGEPVQGKERFDKEQMKGRFLAGLEESPSPLNEEPSESLLTEEQTRERYLVFDEIGSWARNVFLEAQWTTAYINDLPDECFAFIRPGGKKDEDGKTVPRSLRYLPYKSADGEIDLAHLRNALARLPQADLSDDEKKKAEAVLTKASKEAQIGQYRKEGTLDGNVPLKLPRKWKKKLGWAFGEEAAHESLTETQIRQRKLALGENALPPEYDDDDSSFRDNFVDLRRKFYGSLRGTIREGDQWAILAVNEDTILASVYNEAKSRTDYFQLSYVLEGDTIRITSQRRIPTRGDEFDLGKYLVKINAELKGSKI